MIWVKDGAGRGGAQAAVLHPVGDGGEGAHQQHTVPVNGLDGVLNAHALGAHDDQGAHHGGHMHGDVLGAGRDYHQHAQQGAYRNDGLPLVQGLLVGLGELRDIARIRDQLPT